MINKAFLVLVVNVMVITLTLADVSHLLVKEVREPSVDEVTEGPPRPYAFGYAAGRFPGHIDRTHSEVSDGSGVVQGSYSYVDPRQQIRTVDYTADQYGFHPVLNHLPPPLPQDTVAVQRATQRHLARYNAIAAAHQAGPVAAQAASPADSVAVAHARENHLRQFAEIAAARQNVQPGFVVVPADTKSVELAKNKHYNLYQQIAADHAKIAAELKAQKIARGEPLEEEELQGNAYETAKPYY